MQEERLIGARSPSDKANKLSSVYNLLLATIAVGAILVSGCAVKMPKQFAAPGSGIHKVETKSGADDAPGSTASFPKPAAVPGGRQSNVALILPLTGQSQIAAISEAMKQASELALFDSGVPHVQLAVKDSKGTPEGARAAAEAAVTNKAAMIVGPLLSLEVAAVSKVARPSAIPVLAFSNDSMVAGQGTFLISYLPEPEVERVISFAGAKGIRRFAALIPDDPYGALTEKAFRASVAALQASIIALEKFSADTTLLLEPIQRLAEAMKVAEASGEPIQALFLPGSHELMSSIAPILAHAGINSQTTKLLGTGAWESPLLGQHEIFVGGWFAGPDPQGWRNFSSRYFKAYGTTPPRIAILAYDAVTIAVEVSAIANAQQDSVQRLLINREYRGVEGTIGLQPNGLPKRALAILQVEPGGARVIDPAQVDAGKPRVTATNSLDPNPIQIPQ